MFRVRATDAVGNVQAAPTAYSWTVDVTPPDTFITSGPASGAFTSPVTFAFGSTEAGVTFRCRVDGGAGASRARGDAD